ncbi:hypothetical protein [Thermosynechococcus sp. M55_K2018_012]|nr:hypothetical protein [Thermosynechococcus sp. M55_K2018_012]
MDSRTILVGWLRSQFAEEKSTGFARLRRVPDTHVIRFLDHFASLNEVEQTSIAAVLSEWASYPLSGTPLPQTIYEQFARATAIPGRSGGLRYTNVNLLAGLKKKHGDLVNWFQSRGIGGMALQLPELLVRDVSELVPVKPASLRRLVRTAFAQRFAATDRDMGSEIWCYDGTLGESSVRVMVRYSGRMSRPQLDYQVQVRSANQVRTLPPLCFESVLGVGFGQWDYLTTVNAERSVELLGELVESVVNFAERLPVLNGAEPGVAADGGPEQDC